MKTWIRRIAIAAFVLSFAPILPRVGKVLAQTAPDFTFIANGTKGQITYETANCNNLGNSSVNPGASVISCQEPFWDSDSYSINAGIDTSNGTDLGTDLTTNGLLVAFFPESDCNGPPLNLQLIPGNAMHNSGNKKWTIYSFEGNVPNLEGLIVQGFPPLYDHLEMNLMIPADDPADSALHIQANANLCNWFNGRTPLTAGQPASMAFSVGPFEASGGDDYSSLFPDGQCVNLTPTYSTKDVSSAACGVFVAP